MSIARHGSTGHSLLNRPGDGSLAVAIFVRGGIAEIAWRRLERCRDLAIAATIRAVAHRASIANKEGLALLHRTCGIVAFASAASR